MKNYTVEIHALEVLPPNNLNRGETNEPKTLELGGVIRNYVSSQCWKKAMRDYYYAHNVTDQNKGIRTRDISTIVNTLVEKHGYSKEDATRIVNTGAIWKIVGFSLKDNDKSDEEKTKDDEDVCILASVFAFHNTDFEKFADVLAQYDVHCEPKRGGKYDVIYPKANKKSSKEEKDYANAFKKSLASVFDKVPTDVALFGRMLAGSEALTVAGATQVAPAWSVSEATVDSDYYIAMDEMTGVTGAGMIGTKEFASGILYRYGCVSSNILEKTLDGNTEAVETLIGKFIEAFTKSVPTGSQTGYASNVLPYYTYVTITESTPQNFGEAFEEAVPKDVAHKNYVQEVFEDFAVEAYETTTDKPVKAFVVGKNSKLDAEQVHLSKLGDAVCMYLHSN